MCNYCRKLTQSAYELREGYDINTGYEGEAFIDFFNNLIIHLEGENSIEVNMPIKYCPWCGDELKKIILCVACEYNIGSSFCPACKYNYRECALQGCCLKREEIK